MGYLLGAVGAEISWLAMSSSSHRGEIDRERWRERMDGVRGRGDKFIMEKGLKIKQNKVGLKI